MGIQPNLARSLVSVAAVLCITGPAIAQDTPISELVIYGLDGDFGMSGEGGAPGRLFRFHPGSGTYQVIGDTYLAGTSIPLWDWESLAYIPDGPTKGAYSVPLDQQSGSPKQKLIQVNLFDASCTVVGSADLGNVRGLTPVKIGGQWKLQAVRTQGNTSRLFVINPATGAPEGSESVVDTDPGPGVSSVRLFGLARDAIGALLAVSHVGNQSRIWEIDPSNGAATSLGPAANAPRVEALEVAVGNSVPAFSGLPAGTLGWPFDRGVLMGFADDNATMYIFNPLNGAAEPLTSIEGNPITVPWTDIEGIMFLTETQDPGAYVFDGCD